MLVGGVSWLNLVDGVSWLNLVGDVSRLNVSWWCFKDIHG